MYAVIEIGSTQFKVAEGDTISTDLLNSEDGKSVTLDKVLMFAKGADVRIGQPYVKDVKVKAKVVNHLAGDKVTAFKYRRRQASASKIGHRQKYARLNITSISA
jgi:large subunit ribosomal protein L21